MKRALVLGAVALVSVTNIAALALGALNRRAVTSDVTLTERELRLTAVRSSVTLLRIHWLQPSPLYFRDEFVSRAGFVPAPVQSFDGLNEHARRQLARQVYVALEYDGPAWQQYRDIVLRREPPAATGAAPLTAEQVERQRRAREQTIAEHSRLFAIDLDLDPERLRSRHPDRSRVLISLARASLTVQYDQGRPLLVASVTQMMPFEINVPRPFSVVLRDLTQGHVTSYGDALLAAPRYSVRVHYGRFHEPWISDLTPWRP